MITDDLITDEERATPFELAKTRADAFAVNMFLAQAMDSCITDHFKGKSERSPTADAEFTTKMILAGKTLESLDVSA